MIWAKAQGSFFSMWRSNLFEQHVLERLSFPHHITSAAWLQVVRPVFAGGGLFLGWDPPHLRTTLGFLYFCAESRPVALLVRPGGQHSGDSCRDWVAPGPLLMPGAPAFADLKFPSSLLRTKLLLLHLFRCCIHFTLEL